MKVLTAFGLTLLLAFAVTGERAEAREYPYCLIVQSGSGDGGEDCLYSTLEQCRASQFGGGTYCKKNPAYWWGKPDY